MSEPLPTSESLTRREQQIAEAYANGKTYKAIAAALGVAPATIRTHLGSIYRKFGVSTKIGLSHTLAVAGKGRKEESPRPNQIPSAGRRQISVLCARITDLDAVLDGVDPEEAAIMIQQFRRIVSSEVSRHGGEVVDAGSAEVVACFGISRADETDAERAVRYAVDLDRAMDRDTARMQVPMKTRAAVWSGQVVHLEQRSQAANCSA